ncbi:MAG: hypothetical protein V4628_16765 [Pseudomonadota bacterium]
MRNLIILTSAFIFTGAASAQELTLFEQIEADPEAEQPAQAMPMGMIPQNGEPAFTLRGTSRFGDEFTTTLINRNGEAIKVKWHEGENTPVPGFDGFSVVAISAKSVSLSHPAFDSCVASDVSGVSCTDNNLAVLSMANGMPLASNGTPPDLAQDPQAFGDQAGGAFGVEPAMVQNAEGQQVFINPFSGEAEVVAQPSPEEQTARAERQQRRAERLNQFEAVRIDPADVPPGMRLVRTPFGDRIVPERE